jgi:hypothetical protein
MSAENEFTRYKFMVQELKWRIEQLAGQVAALAEDTQVGDRSCHHCGRRFLGHSDMRLCSECQES